MTSQTVLDISSIKYILPHQSPFLFVERVLEIKPGERIIAEKRLSLDEYTSATHSPAPAGLPLPGVLVAEALAQTGGLLLGLTWGQGEKPNAPEEELRFSLANLNIRFSAPAKVGETLRLEAALLKGYGKLFLFQAAAFAGNVTVAEGSFTLAHER